MWEGVAGVSFQEERSKGAVHVLGLFLGNYCILISHCKCAENSSRVGLWGSLGDRKPK